MMFPLRLIRARSGSTVFLLMCFAREFQPAQSRKLLAYWRVMSILDEVEQLSKALQAGIVWINCAQPSFIQAPRGGIKRSGLGHELGEWGHENYLSVKQVTRTENWMAPIRVAVSLEVLILRISRQNLCNK